MSMLRLGHLSTETLERIVERDRNGWYRPGSPFANAAVAAQKELERRGATETQEAEAVKITDTFPAVRDTN